MKQEKLENAELLQERNIEGMSPEEQKKNQSFTNSLVTKVRTYVPSATTPLANVLVKDFR